MDNMGFGLWMTVMGMGTVFGLLAVLMGVLWLIGRMDELPGRRKASPTKAEGAHAPSEDTLVEASEAEPAAAGDLTAEQIAAIAIAVITHAKVRRGQAAPAMRRVAPGSQLFASRWVSVGRSYQNQPWKTR